jgi:uncharacterized protein YifE (UPF0438 family)
MRHLGKFYDDKNFPYGFRRAGFFTINEASILEQYGVTMQQLSGGALQPIDDEESQFLLDVAGGTLATSDLSRSWMKYMNKLNHRSRLFTLCGSYPKPSVSRGEHDEFDDSSDNDELETMTIK